MSNSLGDVRRSRRGRSVTFFLPALDEEEDNVTGPGARHVDVNNHVQSENGGTDVNSSMPSRAARDKRNQSRLQTGPDRGKLSALEEEFIYAAEFGDIPTAQRILEDNSNFSVDYSDILGRTPLRLAVGNEHLEVVELLLDRCNISSIHEALLQAISAGHEQIAETILKHPKYRDAKKENKRIGETDYFFNTTSEDSPFSSDITPLILAAERNQFEIVQLLLLRGETIQKPHHYYCACQECSNKLQFDQLRLAKTRLNAYKGLASGAYISLSSKDPIMTAFELARELRRVARVEKYFKNDYLALADQLSDYVVRLLDKVRGHDELEILLDKTGKSSDTNSYERLARLKLAIRYNEKKFVAHPSCQQKLVSIWYSDLRVLERSNWFLRAFIVFLLGIVYPVMAVMYWIAPRTKIGKFLRSPCIKFIGHTVSFLWFVVMIIISSIQEKDEAINRKLSSFNDTYKSYKLCRDGKLSPCDNRTSLYLQVLQDNWVVRNNEPVTINILLSLWIVGMLWQELKQVYNEGLYGYFDSLYNYLDCAVLLLYISSFTLRYLSIIKAQLSIVYFQDAKSWAALAEGNVEARTMMYWLIADRYMWNAWDPHLVGEGLFAVANVISFTKISYLLPANELSGPMQISLARMLTDIMKFAIIFLVIFAAFMVGLQNLYWYYPQEVRHEVELVFHDQPRNIVTSAQEHFGDLEKTFRTVFWSLFGRGESSAVELGGFEHTFTQNVGYCIFGAYNITTVIVLLNMLIAMMSRSFELIQSEADTEWKFARTKLYMEYINDDCTLPVPFNIIPTPKALVYIVQFFWKKIRRPEPEIRGHPGRIKDIELYIGTASGTSRRSGRSSSSEKRAWDELEHDASLNKGIKHFQQTMSTTNGFVRTDSDPGNFPQKLTYQRVMKRIVKRYIFDMQRESDVNEGDFDEIKQDISSFRYEMLNHLTGSQRETKTNATRLDALQIKMDRLIEHQLLLLKHMNIKNPATKSGEPLKSSFKKHHRNDTPVSPESAIFDYIDEEPDDAATGEIVRESNVRVSLRGDAAEVSSADSGARDDSQSDDGSVSHIDAQVQVEYPSASRPNTPGV